MNLRRLISRRIDLDGEGFSVRAAIQVAIAANVNERDGRSSVASEQHVVQRSRRSARREPTTKEEADE
jgi:hypothetical protein